MKNKKYLDRAAAEVARAKERLPHFAGECSACRWSRNTMMERVCEHPAVVCAAFNIADADKRKWIQECREQRDEYSSWGPVLCGPDGALFEQREPTFSWWARWFGQSERTDV